MTFKVIEFPLVYETNFLLSSRSGLVGRNLWEPEIIRQRVDSELWEKESAGKVVLIGLFESVKNIYETAIDQHKVPIEDNMSGILVNLNNFLNVATGLYLKRAPLIFVFLFNSLIALLMCFISQLLG